MLLTRRILLGSAVTAALVPAARAAEPDGFVLLEAKAGEAQILPAPAPKTAIWGFGGQTPGPVLRIKRGQDLKVRLVNRLTQPTALHWRGLRLPNWIAGAAGLVQNAVEPGETREIMFTPPDAGTFLYQPWIKDHCGEQLGRGLFGAVVVEEEKPLPFDEEFVLLLNDWRLDARAQIVGDFDNAADVIRQGRYGALATANAASKPAPTAQKPGARLLLRIVNASNARIMRLFFDGGAPRIIAIDGQGCDPFEPAGHTAPLGPGARCDVLFDLPQGEGQTARLVLRGELELPDASLFEFVTKGAPRAPLPPVPLKEANPNPLLPQAIRLEAAKRFDLVIDGGWKRTTPAAFKPQGDDLRRTWTINGAAGTGFDGPPLFQVKAGTPVTINIVNKTLFPHAMLVQGHVLRLLHDLDDGWEPYWRDSVIAPEQKTRHIAFIADNPGKWVIGSAVMEHFGNGLAGWFEVTS